MRRCVCPSPGWLKLTDAGFHVSSGPYSGFATKSGFELRLAVVVQLDANDRLRVAVFFGVLVRRVREPTENCGHRSSRL